MSITFIFATAFNQQDRALILLAMLLSEVPESCVHHMPVIGYTSVTIAPFLYTFTENSCLPSPA